MSALTNRYVTIEVEDAYGTEPGTPNTEEVGWADSESFQHKQDILLREDMSRFATSKAVVGKQYTEGDITLPVESNRFTARLFHAIFGVDTVAGTSPSVHTLTPTTDDSTLNSFTVRIGREDKQHLFTGMVVDSITVRSQVNEYAELTVSWLGQNEEAVETLQTVTFPTEASEGMIFADSSVKFNDSDTASNMIKSFEFTISRNRDMDNATSLGSQTYVRAPPPQRFVVTGSLEFNQVPYTAVVSEPTYDNLITEGGSQVNPDDAAADHALQLTLSDGTDTFEFNFFKVQYENVQASVDGRNTQTMSVDFHALYDNEGNNPPTATLGGIMNCIWTDTANLATDLDTDI